MGCKTILLIVVSLVKIYVKYLKSNSNKSNGIVFHIDTIKKFVFIISVKISG